MFTKETIIKNPLSRAIRRKEETVQSHRPPLFSPQVWSLGKGKSPAINKNGTPKRIRTAAAAVKGRCPRPLDDGGTKW